MNNNGCFKHFGSFHRRYVGPDDPAPFKGIVENLSFHLSNMNLDVARLDWFDDDNGVVVTRIDEEEIVETYGGGEDYYILMVAIGPTNRFWKLLKKKDIKEVICKTNNGKAQWHWRSAYLTESHSWLPCTWVLNTDNSKKTPKQRIPSRTMEWINSTYFLPYVDKEAQYKRKLLKSWDEEVTTDGGQTISGIPWLEAYSNAWSGGDAYRCSIGSNSTSTTVDLYSYILTQPSSAHEDPMDWSYLEFLENSTWSVEMFARWVPADPPPGGSWVWTRTLCSRSHNITNAYVADNTIAIGDHKRAGNIMTSAGSDVREIKAELTEVVAYSKQETRSIDSVEDYSPLMYGVHELWPATQIIISSRLTASYSGVIEYGEYPASVSYSYDYAGSSAWAQWQMGNGDDEWVFVYAVGTYHATAVGGDSIQLNGYASPETGEFGAWKTESVLDEGVDDTWVSFRTLKAFTEYENGNDDFEDIDGLDFKRTKGIAQIRILSSDTSVPFNDRWRMSWFKGADIDTHFIVLFQESKGRAYSGSIKRYKLLVVNKQTGLYELIDLGTSDDWGQDYATGYYYDYDVLIKGIGPVKYKYKNE